MLKKDIEKFLSNIPDDFDVKIIGSKRIPDEMLKTMSYPYPLEYFTYEFNFGDICYSEKVTSFQIDLDNPLE